MFTHYFEFESPKLTNNAEVKETDSPRLSIVALASTLLTQTQRETF